ncbi:hypothetical protein [Natronomonas amylolytica]|uniref:hypothetical protein n=1 Tax=Natronomonas amylolytica TaxID=3108498 RepID=UPI00300BCDB3
MTSTFPPTSSPTSQSTATPTATPTPSTSQNATIVTKLIGQGNELLSEIPVEIILLLITIGLSGLGVYLSVGTHVFQVNTGLRESLEQLDDVLIGKNTKVRVILHDFEYSPLRNSLPRSTNRRRCVLEFRVYELNHQNIGGAGQPIEIRHFIEGLAMENIEEFDYVTSAEEDSYWMRVSVESIDPAKCREISSKVMRKIVEVN